VAQNMGVRDRELRFMIAVAIFIAYGLGQITATWALWMFGIIGIVMLVTAVAGFCPLYVLFGISTKEPTTHGK
jgi:ABC-type glycerol-3-phosphate transport system permease component